MSNRSDKTEAPTAKRKADSKKKGQVSKSQDLSAWATMLAATYALPATIRSAGNVTSDALASARRIGQASDPQAVVAVLGHALQGGLMAAMPILLVCIVVGVGSQLGQTGLVLSLHPLKPDFKRINPMKGLKNLLSPKSLWQTAKQVAKSAVIAKLAWPHVQAINDRLTMHGRVPVGDGIGVVARELIAMVRVIAWGVIGVAALDYMYQRRTHRADLRMTKQQVKEEMKQSEGNPQLKQRIRSLQMAASRNRMMSAVAGATVVVTNPTHIAVAIVYDPAKGGAPKVVAIGTDVIAGKIRELARSAGVPVIEAKPLARALWRSCDVGDEIPVVLYEAVAKVLAFIRRVKGTLLESAAMLPLPHSYNVDRSMLDALPARRGKRGLRAEPRPDARTAA